MLTRTGGSGRLVPEIRGDHARHGNLSMNDFLAGLLAEEQEDEQERERTSHICSQCHGDKRAPCDPSRASSSEQGACRCAEVAADYPFAQLPQEYSSSSSSSSTTTTATMTMDQFLSEMQDDLSDSDNSAAAVEERVEQEPMPVKEEQSAPPPPKTRKKRARKKAVAAVVEEEPVDETKEEEEPVDETKEVEVVAEKPRVAPKGKGRSTRKRTASGSVNASSSNKKARPTPPASPISSVDDSIGD